MKFKLAAVAVAVAATLALTACGGGGGGGGGGGFVLPPLPSPPPPPPPPPPAPPPPAPAPAPIPSTRTFMYEALPVAADAAAFAANLNAQGARGFRFLSGFAFTTSPTTVETVEGYVRDMDATYSYETKPVSADSAAFLSQANEAGGRGFQWAGAYSVNGTMLYLYRRNNTAPGTFNYRVATSPSTKADFLAQSNSQGAEGFHTVTHSFIIGSSPVATIYEKNTASSATYTYEIADPAGSDDAFMAQLNERGARGLRLRSEFIFSDGNGVIYAKDSSQSATFSAYSLAPEGNSVAFIQQANTEGAKGAGLIGGLVLPSGAIRTLYFTPVNCNSGSLCGPVSLFGV